MKKIMFLLGVLAIISAYSCSNDFDLVEEGGNVPVVFGLLSKADTAHYIRVEKAFIDPTTDAFEIAQIPDSIYYESISVTVEHVSSGTVYQLERVDGNLEGYPREEGIFANAPNFLYKFKLPQNEELVGGDTYRLILNRGDNSPEVTAETIVLDDLNVTRPMDDAFLRFEENRQTNFRWSTGAGAVFFDVTLRLNYLENSVDDPTTFENKSLIWPLAKNIDKNDDQNIGEYALADGSDFFRFIALSLQDSGNLVRDFKDIDVIVTGGDQNLSDYINIGLANTGITSSQEIPTFTNLSEGLGIFGSKNVTVREGIVLLGTTEDSLRLGIITKDLNFL